MAGRNISVTHAALGTVRVMRTGGMMGEVVGMAASIKVTQDRKQLSVSYLGSKAYFDFNPHGGRIIIRM